MKYKVFIGADHRGVKLKQKMGEYLKALGHDVVDLGAFDEEKVCDYPDLSYKVAKEVAATRHSRGILVCMTGIGHAMAANKIPGVYAALCYNVQAAELSRQHNDANVLVLGSKFVSQRKMFDIIKTWLTAEFEGGRHARRVRKIKKIEKEFMK